MKTVVTGTVNLMKSDGPKICVCCKGPHIFSRGIVIKFSPSPIWSGMKIESVSDVIYHALAKAGEEAHGRKVTVIIDIEDPA